MSADPNFIQNLEAQAETFFEHMKEQIHDAVHEAEAPNEPAADAAQTSAPEVSATAPAVASTGEEAFLSQPETTAKAEEAGHGEDPNVAASAAVEQSPSGSPSATNAPSDAGESQTVANTPAEPQT